MISRVAAAGVEAFLPSRAAAPAVKVIINWAHKIDQVRPGHPPPLGTQAEIQEAVETALQTKNYTVGADGVIRGTTKIQGVEVGFQGKLVGDIVRISTVFGKP